MTTVTDRAWLAFGLVACVGIVKLDLLRADDLPTSGMYIPELDVFDQTMQDFMAVRGIEAGLLGTMKDGCTVYERGFGWKDESPMVPLPEDAVMRIASCGKPITAAAIRKLADTGAISLEDHVFDLGEHEQSPLGILNYAPFPELDDLCLVDMTVENLIDYQFGWGRSTDPTYSEVAIALAMDVLSPPGASVRPAMPWARRYKPTPAHRTATARMTLRVATWETSTPTSATCCSG